MMSHPSLSKISPLRALLPILAFGSSVVVAQAQSITYQLDYTSAGSAAATGFMTIDWGILGTQPNVLQTTGSLTGLGVTDLSLTVTGAASGNGAFAFGDFQGLVFQATAPLDINANLVGQAALNDLNFFNADASPNAPRGTAIFTLTTAGGAGDAMTLASFAPVPEPSEYAMLAGLGLVGFGAWRKWKQHSR